MTDIDEIAVVGAGRMGHGIALVYALDGNEVRLYDTDASVLEKSRERIEEALATLVGTGHVEPATAEAALDNLTREQEFEAAVRGVDLVTEAVVEDLGIKRQVFDRLDEHTTDAVLATNTSGLPVDDITDPVADGRRVLGTHWFNPPYIVPLVEVVRGERTGERNVEATLALLESAGKTPVVVEKDIPGFIANRIQAAMSYEAFSLLARGVATPADIDKAVKAGFGFRLPVMGIFEKMDQSGLAIQHEVEKRLLPELDRGTDPNPVVEELVERGETGTEAGRGVYDWSDVSVSEVEQSRDRALLSIYETYRETIGESPPANYTGRREP